MTANTCTLRLNRSFELALVMAKMEAETKCGIASSEAAASTYTDTDRQHSVQPVAFSHSVQRPYALCAGLPGSFT